VDSDFGKPAASLLNKIDTGPFYAAFASPVIHDWLTGVRIDEGAHVLDLEGKIIPGLYAAGEDVGGMVMHGLAKCAVYGMIGGYNAGLGV
jgi:predicted oxidoreductase